MWCSVYRRFTTIQVVHLEEWWISCAASIINNHDVIHLCGSSSAAEHSLLLFCSLCGLICQVGEGTRRGGWWRWRELRHCYMLPQAPPSHCTPESLFPQVQCGAQKSLSPEALGVWSENPHVGGLAHHHRLLEAVGSISHMRSSELEETVAFLVHFLSSVFSVQDLWAYSKLWITILLNWLV